MTNDEYFALAGVNASFLKDVATSTLAHAIYRRTHPPEQSPSMRLGSGFHCYKLENHKFNDRFICQPPDLDGRTKAGKEWRSTVGRKTIITWDQFNLIKGMCDSIDTHVVAGKLFSGIGENERAIVWGGGSYKARLDRISTDGVIDLKTCQDASKDAFSRACFSTYRYDIQAAWYLRAARSQYGAGPIRFLFVCVESAPPHAVSVYELDEAAIENADEEIDLLLPKIEAAKQSGIWPAYSDKVEKLYMPAWMGNSYEVD